MEAIGDLSRAVTRCNLGFKRILATVLRINRRKEGGKQESVVIILVRDYGDLL